MSISINIAICQPSHLFLYIYNKQIVDATEVHRAVETHRVRLVVFSGVEQPERWHGRENTENSAAA